MKINNPLEMRIQDIIKSSNGMVNRSDFDYSPKDEDLFNFIEFSAKMESEAKNLLESAHRELNLSVKQIEAIEKIAFSIMKLENDTIITTTHMAEAINYRPLRDK